MLLFNKILQEDEKYNLAKKYLLEKNKTILLTNVLDSQKALLTYGFLNNINKTSLFICQDEKTAKKMYDDLSFFFKENIFYYPSKDMVFYTADVKSMDISKQRFKIIEKLINNEKIITIMSIESLFDRVIKKDIFKSYIKSFKVGQTLDLNKLIKELVFMGYERADAIEGTGQFSVRGGIIDIFNITMDNAIRIELWGDEIDSIRILDVLSQRSIEKIEEIKIYPVRELVYDENLLKTAIFNVNNELNNIKNDYNNQNTEYLSTLTQKINYDIERLKNEQSFSGIEKYIPFFYYEKTNILNYFDKDSIIFFDEPKRIKQNAELIYNEFLESIKGRIIKGELLPCQKDITLDYNQIINILKDYKKILFTNILTNIPDFKVDKTISFECKSTLSFNNNMSEIINNLIYYKKLNYKIIFLAGNNTKCEMLEKEFNQKNLPAVFLKKESLKKETFTFSPGIIYIIKGSLNNGFENVLNKFIIISDKEVFGEDKKYKKSRKKIKGIKISSFSDLKVGDYIVHENHGIGIFKGIEKIVTNGVSKDYLKLGYLDDGNIYIAINQMDLIQKYVVSNDGSVPKLNKLGTKQWSNTKSKAKKAVQALAKELLKLYAKRQSAKGFAFSKDTIWQKEFEDNFPYKETDDQLNAILDVKADMESTRVMDRLICGDVGFGKTEVAIRASFKAVQDQKQVVFLVPTTILAGQHFNTFVKRMEAYPITIKLLSRFVSQKQQKETINELKNGTVDILIGTHRVLSKDIEFKNLGLIIVDEEQRFGVVHKEKLKKLKENVDVLTLSATPIPRTLHMSMTGIRDMSVLEEPPSERIPVQTYVLENDPEFIKSAINRELNRNGQVYYLFNRVNNIDEETNRIQKLVPNARVAFAHGQMNERELEKIMLEFLNNEIDVLVCTTIIETGLDIANVNTIIIQNADTMGLSQLYQLRGRVGRSNKTSFAYLMYKKNKVLQEVSEKRLQIIKEFTEFGSGFKIAMRDLEIRGAGNLLGQEQHGHMNLVGYEMYCKLLDQAIRKLKGEKFDEDFETLIDLNVNAFISPTYIEDQVQKLEMYKKISLIISENDFFDVQEELEDRFGTIPKAVQNLLDISLMKSFAKNIGIVSIIQRGEKITINFKPDNNLNLKNLINIVEDNKEKLNFNGILTYKIPNENINFIIDLKNIFEKIHTN